MMDSENISSAANLPQKGRAVEEIYQKKSQLEHILLRPDTYIGTTESETDLIWVADGDGITSPFKMVQRNVTYVPGLYKIFDEILVNAADNKQRDSSMSELRVDINGEAGTIAVFNNGNGIPVQIHKEHGVYVPELIFGHLLTSSNYDDSEKKTVGGRNGYGAKLTNIFSTEFIIETQDSERKLRYRQVFMNNMKDKQAPKVSAASGPSWTKITFTPDLSKFGMRAFDKDIVALMTKRVIDIAGCAPKGLKVYLNGKRVDVASFKDYVDMYLPSPDTQRVHEKISDRWEVVIAPTDGHFQQTSFVNSICTIKGGTHVTLIADQAVKGLTELINKKHKTANVKPFQIKNHMWVFVNSLIENPAFDSQTKVNLTSKKTSFGSDPVLSEAFLKKLQKVGIVESVLAYSKFQEDKALKKNDGKKTSGRLVGIPKLEDANEAGGRRAAECTLILTEGDSAKTLAMAGLSIVGRDLFGVFPLRGKVLNVREANHKQIMANQEISYLKQILGLQQGKEYTDAKSLRYGHVMIMTDQDHDGSHIKGLLINLFATFWPSLLRLPGFLTEFITPIVKVSKGSKVLAFYTIPQYEEWRERNNNGKGWKIKYYKGLGTSTSAEAKEYFSAISRNQIPFSYSGEACDKLIELAFSKNAAAQRKEWMAQYVPGTFLDHSVKKIVFQEFINKEFILFALASSQRAIPSIVDGLKPGQRKVLFACFKRKLTKEIKVAQLAGYVAENSAYHHGEVSLAGTIVNLAQNYVGANNINYLWPAGQFGTRALGGKDAASARYIFTYLSPVTRAIFHPADDNVLKFLNEDGQSIEPEWYMPVVPTVLVNGSAGIGMGWSSAIPNYNPRDVVKACKAMIAGDQPPELHPWYKGFVGTMIAKGRRGTYVVKGLVEKVNDTTVHVYELPVERWTADYKVWLEEMLTKNAITAFQEYHTDSTVSFVVSMTAEALAAAEKEGLEKFFKLESSLTTSNMVLFDAQGRIRKYDTVQEILSEFYTLRMDMYQTRKNFLAAKLTAELERLDNRVRFILAVVSENIKIRNVKRAAIVEQLRKAGFKPMAKASSASSSVADESNNDEENEEEKSDEDNMDEQKGSSSSSKSVGDYDYLLSMPLWSLTHERVEAIKVERAQKASELEDVLSTSTADMWLRDLDAFELALQAHEDAERAEMNNERKQQQQPSGAGRGRGGKAGNNRRAGAADDDDDDDDEFEDDNDDAFDSEDEWGGGKKKAQKNKKKAAGGNGKGPSKGSNVLPFIPVVRPKEQSLVVEPEIVGYKAGTRGGKREFDEQDMDDITNMFMSGRVSYDDENNNEGDCHDEDAGDYDDVFAASMGKSTKKTVKTTKASGGKKAASDATGPTTTATTKKAGGNGGGAKKKTDKSVSSLSKKMKRIDISDTEGFDSDDGASDSFDSDVLDSDGDDDDEEDRVVISKKASGKASSAAPVISRPKRVAATKAKYTWDDDDGDSDDSIGDDNDEEEVSEASAAEDVSDFNDDDDCDDAMVQRKKKKSPVQTVAPAPPAPAPAPVAKAPLKPRAPPSVANAKKTTTAAAAAASNTTSASSMSASILSQTTLSAAPVVKAAGSKPSYSAVSAGSDTEEDLFKAPSLADRLAGRFGHSIFGAPAPASVPVPAPAAVHNDDANDEPVAVASKRKTKTTGPVDPLASPVTPGAKKATKHRVPKAAKAKDNADNDDDEVVKAPKKRGPAKTKAAPAPAVPVTIPASASLPGPARAPASAGVSGFAATMKAFGITSAAQASSYMKPVSAPAPAARTGRARAPISYRDDSSDDDGDDSEDYSD